MKPPSKLYFKPVALKLQMFVLAFHMMINMYITCFGLLPEMLGTEFFFFFFIMTIGVLLSS